MALHRRFLELSRALHPDRFARAPDHLRQASLDRMGLVNESYGVLTDREAIRDFLFSEAGLGGGAVRSVEDLELAERWFEIQEKAGESAESGDRMRLFSGFAEELSGLIAASEPQMERLEQAHDLGKDAAAALREMVALRHRMNTLRSMLRDVGRLMARAGLS